MNTPKDCIGIIILGNSGVGKSFLGNVILGREAFKHEYQANAVTTKTEYQKSVFRRQTFAIYNIPGLIEAEQERIDLNKREIDVSFRQHPNAVVLYVFGTNNGRIRSEDVVAFNALHKAYPFSEKSLVVAINGVNPSRPNDYEANTTTTLANLLKMHLPHLYFVNHINESNEKEKELVRYKLVEIVINAMPKIHKKVQEINLQAAEMSKLTKQIAEFQKQIEQDREKHRAEVANLKREFDDRERRQRLEQEERERRLRTEQQDREDKLRAEIKEKERQSRAEQDALKKQIEEAQRQEKENQKMTQQNAQNSIRTKHFVCQYFNCNNRCNRCCTGYYGFMSGNHYCSEYGGSHITHIGKCEKCQRSTDLADALRGLSVSSGGLRPDLGVAGYITCTACNHVYCYYCCFI